MGKTTVPQRQSGRTIVVVEVAQLGHRGPEGYECVVSIAGHEGTVTKMWPSASSALTASQAEDLVIWVSGTVMGGLIAWGGVQGVLPMA